MLLLHTSSSIIVFACLFNLVVADSSYVYTTTWNISVPRKGPAEYLVRGEHFALDDRESVYYTTCRNDSNPFFHLCHVVRETLLDDAETVQIQSCPDVAVPMDVYNQKLWRMAPFASSHVSLLSRIGGDRVWIIVNLLDCSEARLEFPIETHNFDDIGNYYASTPIVYRDHFECVVKSKAHCESEEPIVCRVGYSYNGTKLTPKPIMLHGSNFDYTVQPLTDSKGFYSVFTPFKDFVNRKDYVLNVSYSEPSGENRIIATVVTPQRILNGSQISVGHELLSICWPFRELKNHYIHCFQTDTHKVLLNVTVQTVLDEVNWIMPFNLPNGDGILVAEWSRFGEPNLRIRWLRKDGSGAGKWLKVRPGWEDMGNCTDYSPRGIESRAGYEICIDLTCHQDVGEDGWLIKDKKVCLLKSRIFDALR